MNDREFEKKGNYDTSILIDEKRLRFLITQIEGWGFNSISIKVPKEEDIEQKKSYSLKNFINLGKDFSAVIIAALNTKKNEELKILIVNSIKDKVSFDDRSFPIVDRKRELIKYNIYVKTSDPIRSYGLFHYLVEILKEYVFGKTQTYLTVTFISLAALAFIYYRQTISKDMQIIVLIAFVIAIFIGLLILPKTGLRLQLNNSVDSTPVYVQKLKDNRLVILASFVTTIIAGVIILIIQYLLRLN